MVKTLCQCSGCKTIRGQGTKIPCAAWLAKKKAKRKKKSFKKSRFALFVYILGSSGVRKMTHVLNDSAS